MSMRGIAGLRDAHSNFFQLYAWLEKEADDMLSLIEALAVHIAGDPS